MSIRHWPPYMPTPEEIQAGMELFRPDAQERERARRHEKKETGIREYYTHDVYTPDHRRSNRVGGSRE